MRHVLLSLALMCSLIHQYNCLPAENASSEKNKDLTHLLRLFARKINNNPQYRIKETKTGERTAECENRDSITRCMLLSKAECYQYDVRFDCCATCTRYRNTAPASCPYGDKYPSLCHNLIPMGLDCKNVILAEACCESCAGYGNDITSPGPGCQRWTMIANTNVAGGHGIAATSVATCQSACESNTACNGVDWVTNAAQGQQCWLSGSSWSGQRNTGNAAGVNHYDLNRNCGQPGPGKAPYLEERSGSISVRSYECNPPEVRCFTTGKCIDRAEVCNDSNNCEEFRDVDGREKNCTDYQFCSGMNKSDCYDSNMYRRCQSKCEAWRNTTAPYHCQFGDKKEWCDSIYREYACRYYDADCCETCGEYRTGIPDYQFCSGMNKSDCYDSDMYRRCQSKCEAWRNTTAPEHCQFGDKREWCHNIYRGYACYYSDADCCETCGEYRTGIPGCEYGDYVLDARKCQHHNTDCNDHYDRKICCGFCSGRV